MASGFAGITLCGYLVRDCEITHTRGGTACCKSTVAVNETYKNPKTGELKDEALFIQIVLFGPRGESFAKYHEKASPVLLRGELKMDEWDDKTTGQRRQKFYVRVDQWHFVPKASGKQESEGKSLPFAATMASRPTRELDDADRTPF